MRSLWISTLLLSACASHSSTTPRGSTPVSSELDTSALAVAHARGSPVADHIDSLIARVVGIDAQFAESGEGFNYTGEADSAFQTLAHLTDAVPRLVECLSWDKPSNSKWRGHVLLAGVVCDHVLVASSYVANRMYPYRLPANLYASGWGDYRNPSIDTLRRVQRVWREYLSSSSR